MSTGFVGNLNTTGGSFTYTPQTNAKILTNCVAGSGGTISINGTVVAQNGTALGVESYIGAGQTLTIQITTSGAVSVFSLEENS